MWPFKRRTEDRQLWQVGDVYPGPSTRSGVHVDPDQALRLSAVWACRRLLADVISSLPVDAFRVGSREPIDPTPSILMVPAADTPIDEWLDQVVMAATGSGNAFGLVTARGGAAMRPSQIELLDAARVTPQIDPQTRAVTWHLDGRQIDPEDLWHFRRYPVPGRPLGLSPIAYAAETIGLGLAAQQFGAGFFGDGGGVPSGLLTTDMTLSFEQASELRERWKAVHGGRRGTAILGNGAKFQAISVSPEESQFLESQKFSVQQIARIYGIAPELIGSNSGHSMTYANIEMRDVTLMKYCVGPWLKRLETRLSMLLPRGQYCKFNANAVVRTDMKTRYESYQIALTSGFLTIDEVRELEDRAPLAGTATPTADLPQGAALGAVA